MSLVSPTRLHMWQLSQLSGSAPACKFGLFLGTSSLQQVKTTKMPQTLTKENVCPPLTLEVLFYGDVLSPSLNVRCWIIPSSMNNSPRRHGAAKGSVKERGLALGISFFTVYWTPYCEYTEGETALRELNTCKAVGIACGYEACYSENTAEYRCLWLL